MINLCVFCKNRYAFEKKLQKAIETNKKIIVISHNEIQRSWAERKLKIYTEETQIVVTSVTKQYEDDTFDIAFLMADSRSGDAKNILANIGRLGNLKLGMLICNARIHEEKELPITAEEVVKYLSAMLQNSNGKNVCGVKVKNVPGVRGGKTIDTDNPETINRIVEMVKDNKAKTFFNMDLSSELKKMCKSFVEIDFKD